MSFKPPCGPLLVDKGYSIYQWCWDAAEAERDTPKGGNFQIAAVLHGTEIVS